MAEMTMISQAFYQKGLILSLNPEAVLMGQNWSEQARGQDGGEVYFLSPEFNFKKVENAIKAENLCRGDAKKLKFRIGKTHSPGELDWRVDSGRYQQDFNHLMEKIKSKNLIKAVPFVVFKTPKPKDFNAQVLPYILSKLLQNSPSQFLFGKWDQSGGFVGSTPEILFSGCKENMSLMALAGTVKADDPKPMSEDQKLWDEHQFVVKDIDEKLSPQKVLWQKTTEAIYGPLKHLKTNGFVLNYNGDYLSLLESLSPTAALGVFPKSELVNNKQPLHIDERGAYGAPFGVITGDFAHFVVCIRGLFWDENTLSIPVGGGIIEQSDYQTEFKELELKFKSTKNKLGL